jgi:site-specific recombinase XerD
MKKKQRLSLRGQQRILHSYENHLREVVGLSPKTCQNHSRDIARFLEEIPIQRTSQLAQLTGVELTDHLRARSTDCQSASLRQVASSLRQFLRFAQEQGWTGPFLRLAVPKIACRSHRDLPAYLNHEQLAVLLASWDPATAEGQRDLAIGLCLVRLGMRAGEAGALGLDDIDWRQGILHLRQSKNGSPAQLPLLVEVGEAIAHYLQSGRPRCDYRQVFLLHQPPSPMDSQAIGRVIRRALQRCGLAVVGGGAHLLRHTLASHLVQRGASLKEVADVLRHRHLNSAAVYAHVDLPGLRPLAQPWAEEATL